ncbi:glycosyltransferase family 4 protein [uncultured Roseibium sp.]|uniref:glycosyltransferase family 4 protein n=1 Tax=uncultured Roseibium sp. TaxID=1936171 RepID=UPI00261154EF|nr:glycosyltransferase family 4 protein [uncultured Roseibium sp.]
MGNDLRLKVLVIAPHLSIHDVGEGPLAHHLVKAMCKHADVTILALEAANGPPLASQLPEAEVVTWQEPSWLAKNRFVRTMIKPHVFYLSRQVKKWLSAELAKGRQFDIAHQMLPAAPRYPTALRFFPIPYVIGSLGGSLPTPAAFQNEATTEKLSTKLRFLDPFRFRYDPWLRASYGKADLVMGVAPYMEDVMSAAPIRKFEPFLTIGLDEVPDPITRTRKPGELTMLSVGRVTRTKGLRDSVRALALLKDLPHVRLVCVGDGDDLPECRAEAEKLGVQDRVTFLGRLPRDQVEAHYRQSDLLIFPSFRESMGAVLYEAMRWSLPVITTRLGGPGSIVDETCGLQVDVKTPSQLAEDLAAAIRKIAFDPELGQRLGTAARQKVLQEALWEQKADRLIKIYRKTLGSGETVQEG